MKREVRSKSVGTKVTEAELRVLESRAERAGLTLSEWVRDVLLGIEHRDRHAGSGASDPGRGSGDANDPAELHAESGRRECDSGGVEQETGCDLARCPIPAFGLSGLTSPGPLTNATLCSAGPGLDSETRDHRTPLPPARFTPQQEANASAYRRATGLLVTAAPTYRPSLKTVHSSRQLPHSGLWLELADLAGTVHERNRLFGWPGSRF